MNKYEVIYIRDQGDRILDYKVEASNIGEALWSAQRWLDQVYKNFSYEITSIKRIK